MNQPLVPLTIRESKVLELMRLGLSNKGIARTLDISHLTVRNHVHAILMKFGQHRRVEVTKTNGNATPEWTTQTLMERLKACGAVLYQHGLLTDSEKSRLDHRIHQREIHNGKAHG